MKYVLAIALTCLVMVNGQGFAVEEKIDQVMTLGDLPKDILQDLLALVDGRDLVEAIDCVDVEPNDIELFLFTRSNKEKPIVLDVYTTSPIGKDKPLILITQGWLQTGEYGYGMEALKDAYLKKDDVNVVIVSWKRLSWDLYPREVCKMPKIARIVADYLCQVNFEKGLPMENVHLVGHSLGGQLFGFVGQFTQEMCKKRIGRITGLDPAGPLYNDAPASKRLDETDATFVDVIHTNGKLYGYDGRAGHADFYVNCGTLQPGCVVPNINIKSLWNIPLPAVFCSHIRSIDYMIESVTTNNFVAIKCNYCPVGCPPLINLIIKSGKTTFGEQCAPDTRGKYYLSTNNQSPYASGRN